MVTIPISKKGKIEIRIFLVVIDEKKSTKGYNNG